MERSFTFSSNCLYSHRWRMAKLKIYFVMSYERSAELWLLLLSFVLRLAFGWCSSTYKDQNRHDSEDYDDDRDADVEKCVVRTALDRLSLRCEGVDIGEAVPEHILPYGQGRSNEIGVHEVDPHICIKRDLGQVLTQLVFDLLKYLHLLKWLRGLKPLVEQTIRHTAVIEEVVCERSLAYPCAVEQLIGPDR